MKTVGSVIKNAGKLLNKLNHQSMYAPPVQIFTYKLVNRADIGKLEIEYKLPFYDTLDDYYQKKGLNDVLLPVIETVKDSRVIFESIVRKPLNKDEEKEQEFKIKAFQTTLLTLLTQNGLTATEMTPKMYSEFVENCLIPKELEDLKLGSPEAIEKQKEMSGELAAESLKGKKPIPYVAKMLFPTMQVLNRNKIKVTLFEKPAMVLSDGNKSCEMVAMKMTSKSDVEKYENSNATLMKDEFFEGNQNPLKQETYLIPNLCISFPLDHQDIQKYIPGWHHDESVRLKVCNFTNKFRDSFVDPDRIRCMRFFSKKNLVEKIPSWEWVVDENDEGPSNEELYKVARKRQEKVMKQNEMMKPENYQEKYLKPELAELSKFTKGSEGYEDELDSIKERALQAVNMTDQEVEEFFHLHFPKQ